MGDGSTATYEGANAEGPPGRHAARGAGGRAAAWLRGHGGRPDQPERTIGSYLAEIAARLTGPARVRRDILAELGAGLADAADAHRSAGLSPARAARAAIAEFGRADQVASGFRAELAAAAVDLTLLTLLALLATQVAGPSGRPAALPAAAASLTRLILAARAARNCLTTREAWPLLPGRRLIGTGHHTATR